jgi:uridine kinase
MKVRLTADLGKFRKEIETREGVTAEEIYGSVKADLPYECVAAKVDNRYKGLSYILNESCDLELLDLRSQEGREVYQNSLSLIYLTAVKDVLGDVRVAIENSLNQGYFTVIHRKEPVTGEEVSQLTLRMQEIIDADMPIVQKEYQRNEGLRILAADEKQYAEKIRLIGSLPSLERLRFYELDGYMDFFYGHMVPSTGYIRKFELMKYRTGVVLRFPGNTGKLELPEYRDQTDLYAAFAEQKKWDKFLDLQYVSDLNEKIENGEYVKLVQLSEALQASKIVEAANRICEAGSRMVLIAGPSSSGKTTFAKRLCIQLMVLGKKALYMGTDDYFIDRDKMKPGPDGKLDFEGIDALDIELFNRNMAELLSGKEADLPTFDFLTGKKEFGRRKTKITENHIIVIEGIHGLNEDLTRDIPREQKFKIYISPLTQLNIDEHNRIATTDERLLRRMVRDSMSRGHDAKSTIDEWPSVRAGEDRNIFPFSGEADMLFNSYHDYEIAVLKKYAEPLLRQIKRSEPEYAEAHRMLQFLSYFRSIDDDSVISCDSILREFIGGSNYVK